MFLKKLITNLCFPKSSTLTPCPVASFTSKSTTPEDDDKDVLFTSSNSNSDDTHYLSDNHQPDFATVFASQRFFFSSPGHSKSIISTPPLDNSSGVTLLGGVPVPKYSPDPYSDFRKSMQEMVVVGQSNSKDDDPAEYLHQLLTCYLSLNPVNTHECIIRAFSDLLVNLLVDKDKIDGRRHGGSRD